MAGTLRHARNTAAFDELFESTSKSGQMMVVQFSMNGCGWCVKIAPTVKALAKQYRGGVFVKVMVEDCGEVCRRYGVQGFPHFKFFLKGKEVATIAGGGPRAEQQLKDNCKKFATKAGPATKAVGWGAPATVQAPHVRRSERKAMHKFLEAFGETSVNQAYHFLANNGWDHARASGAYLEAVVDGNAATPDYFGSVADEYLPRSRQKAKRGRAAAAAPAPAPGAGIPPPTDLTRQSSAERAAAAGNLFAQPATGGATNGRFAVPDGIARAGAGSGGGMCEGGVCRLPGDIPPFQ